MAPSGIPGDLPDVFSLTNYRGSAWWTAYFPSPCGIKIDRMKDLESVESSILEDSNMDCKEGSNHRELWHPEALQGAIGQDPHLQEVGETPDSWEQQLSPCNLSSENIEGLTEKVGTLGLPAARKNRCGAAQKRARRARVAESLAGNSVISQSVSLGRFRAAKSRLCRSPLHLGPRAQGTGR